MHHHLPAKSLTHFLVLACCVAAMSTLMPASATAANTEAFTQTMKQVLQDPALYLSSTTPNEPLLTTSNALVALHPNTRKTIEAVERLVASAKHEVLLQIYEYDDTDEAAQRVFVALQQRVRRAVRMGEPFDVGVVVGSAWPSEHALQQRDIRGLVQELRAATEGHHALNIVLKSYRGSPLAILHTKTLTVDASTSLVMTGNLITHGGIDADSLNMSAEVMGPVVHTLRADWAQAASLSHTDAALGQRVESLGREPLKIVPQIPVAQSQAALAATVLSRRSRWAPWPDQQPSLQASGIIALMGTATHDITIINPSIGAYGIQDAIVEAIVGRGVRVTALLSRYMNADREHYLFGGTNAEQAYKVYQRLFAGGGVEAASRFTVLWGSKDGLTPGATRSSGNIHAKVAAIDDDCLLIGSTNFNWLSFNTSRELSVALMGENVADALRHSIWPALRKTAVPLSSADVPACRKHRRDDQVCMHLEQP